MAKQRMPAHIAEAVIERANYACEAGIPGTCTGRGEDIHHRKLRSQGGKHDLDTCVLLCHSCHMWAHQHTGDAYRMGLLVHGWEKPRYPPAYYRGVYTPREEGT